MRAGGRGGRSAEHHGRSGKQKKAKLKAKRAKKRNQESKEPRQYVDPRAVFQSSEAGNEEIENEETLESLISKLDLYSSKTSKEGVNLLSSKFLRLPTEVVERRKQDSTRPFSQLSGKKTLRISKDFHAVSLGFPKRPHWDKSTTPEQLQAMEEASFLCWLKGVHTKYTIEELSPFEHSLEVWRQLWRTIEKSHVLCIVVDVRNPLLHIPMNLYTYVTKVVKKPVVIVLTKVDLVSKQHVSEWTQYLRANLPQTPVCIFSSKASAIELKGGVKSRRKAITKKLTSEDQEAIKRSAQFLLKTCIEKAKQENMGDDFYPSVSTTGEPVSSARNYPTIGFVGHPNVGKSSLLNGILGKKVVSVSRSCGHTKHWQTHLVKGPNDEVYAELCDSPGLVFPVVWKLHEGVLDTAIRARQIYEVSGLYPIAQIREPFTAVRLVAEAVPLTRAYNLKLDEDDYGDSWSPYAICGTFADMKGYVLSKGGMPDMHRAGLEIIRDVVDGYVLVAFDKPLCSLKELWESDESMPQAEAVPSPEPRVDVGEGINLKEDQSKEPVERGE